MHCATAAPAPLESNSTLDLAVVVSGRVTTRSALLKILLTDNVVSVSACIENTASCNANATVAIPAVAEGKYFVEVGLRGDGADH